jgi:cysteine peptidase C11 family protein
MADYNCPKKKRSEWLIMVYLAGDNNLSASSIGFLQELEAAKYDRAVRVVAGFDPNIPLPRGARYLEIKHHLDPDNPYQKMMDWPLHNDLMAPGHVVVSPDFCKPQPTQHPTEPAADVALARFFDWVRKYYKARKYMLILFGHGPLVAGNTFLMDTTPPSYLKLTDFSKILRKHFGKKLNILACNNCVMNGIETATELYGQVDYMIGSQGLMLVNGWPFRKIIDEVVDHYNQDVARIAENVLKVCARNLLDFTLMERSSEQAIIDVNKFGYEGALLPRSEFYRRHFKRDFISYHLRTKVNWNTRSFATLCGWHG